MLASDRSDARAVMRASALMLGLLLLVAALNIAFAEKIFVRGGLGWDGEFYGKLAMRFPDALFGREIDPYRIQRILPSGIVYAGLRALGLPLDAAHVIRGFEIYNALLLLLGGVLWIRIADALALSLRGRWLGFAGLFVNYAVLKQAFYIPVATDVSALVLGLLMLWAYLGGRRGWLVAAGIAGAFTWPLASIGAAALLILPRTGPTPREDGRSMLPTLAAAALTLFMLALFAFLYYVKGRRSTGFGPIVPIVESVVYLSVAVYAAYVFWTARTLLQGVDWRYASRVVRSLRALDVLLALAVLVVPRLIVRELASPETNEFLSPRTFLGFLVLLPVSRPGILLVSHVVYFGPAVILLAFFWRSFCAAVRALGPGMLAFILLALPITYTPESRQSIMAYPFFVALLTTVVQGYRWPARTYWALATIALVFSKFWLPMHAWLPEGRATDMGVPLHFISHGPWMSNAAYLIQLGAVALATVVLYRLTRAGVAETALPETGARLAQSPHRLASPPGATVTGDPVR